MYDSCVCIVTFEYKIPDLKEEKVIFSFFFYFLTEKEKSVPIFYFSFDYD